MSDTLKVTVIIPAYKAAETLERAVASILTQEDPDLRVLIVDDASPDETGVVARRLADGDSRVEVLTQSKNRGVSAARNAALDRTTTEWVAFLDSDDEWLPGWHQTMLSQASPEVDVVVAGRLVVQANGSVAPAASKAQGVFDGEEACRLAMLDQLTPFPWDKLFRRSMFDGLRFAEGAARFEDMTMNILVYSSARRVVSVSEPVCKYYISGQSLTWGRVPTMQDTVAALGHLEQGLDQRFRSGRFAGPYATMNVLVAMLVAQSAMARGGNSADVRQTLAECRQQLTIARLWATLKAAPVLAFAAGFLRAFPRVYGAAYGLYIRRRYGLR
ncbi:glycosyltransferase family 2 protein [Sinomonas sp. JGH33]|uniref:Glycosyltransferase family 2 protein n=1 Tax=Sinomonas terricola TaxID=3110330 RepID=A0ABU5T8M6_9MICC|nr:glycosyltransferase family 2 protein [Sinomonas sp. JGH33]MEA5456024.1 glycosyltransferase family 2 protein [Sinomonas sp. JGH33]